MGSRRAGVDGDAIEREVARSILGFASDYLRGRSLLALRPVISQIGFTLRPAAVHTRLRRHAVSACLKPLLSVQVRFDGTLWVGSFQVRRKAAVFRLLPDT